VQRLWRWAVFGALYWSVSESGCWRGSTSSPILHFIRKAGAHLLFLPPYSPDLNPIEQVFAKLKTLLPKAAERTVEDTWRRIVELIDHFAPDECANYLVNSGYALT